MERPSTLARKESQRARELAMARLEGGSSPSNGPSSLAATSFVPEGAPLRLSALQRRHLAQQAPQDDNDDAGSDVGSEAFSVFTPSVVAVANPNRQEARSNLIRKLSKRDGPPTPTLEPAAPARQMQSGFKFGGTFRPPPPPAREEEDQLEVMAPPSVRSSVVTNAPSEFRAYRHTYERDRDSAYAKLMQEDHFEYEGLLARKASIKAQKEKEERSKASPKSAASARSTPSIPEYKSFAPPDPAYQFPSPPSTADTNQDPSWPSKFQALSVRAFALSLDTLQLLSAAPGGKGGLGHCGLRLEARRTGRVRSSADLVVRSPGVHNDLG
jgi:hypothetical protein